MNKDRFQKRVELISEIDNGKKVEWGHLYDEMLIFPNLDENGVVSEKAQPFGSNEAKKKFLIAKANANLEDAANRDGSYEQAEVLLEAQANLNDQTRVTVPSEDVQEETLRIAAVRAELQLYTNIARAPQAVAAVSVN